jgi:hypothetical protein
MVTEKIMEVFGAILAFMLGLFPEVALPSWWTSSATWLGEQIDGLDAFGWWLPISAFGNCVTFLLLATSAGLVIGGTRTVISHFTGGGGT